MKTKISFSVLCLLILLLLVPQSNQAMAQSRVPLLDQVQMIISGFTGGPFLIVIPRYLLLGPDPPPPPPPPADDPPVIEPISMGQLKKKFQKDRR